MEQRDGDWDRLTETESVFIKTAGWYTGQYFVDIFNNRFGWST